MGQDAKFVVRLEPGAERVPFVPDVVVDREFRQMAIGFWTDSGT